MAAHKRSRPLHTLVLFTGRGKERWFTSIAEGSMPDTVMHAFARIHSANMEVAHADAQPFRLSTWMRILRSDAIVSTDTSPVLCAAAMMRKYSGGLIGPRTFLVAVNTSAVMGRLSSYSLRSFFIRSCWRALDGIFCLARFQIEDMVSSGVLRERTAFIPLGIDATFMQASGAPKEGEYILSVGQDAGRDFEYLLRLAERVPYPIRIVTQEKNLPRSTHLPPNVTVEYGIPVTEMRDRMLHARFTVVPTTESLDQGSDCSGQTVVLQSLAAGVPACVSVRPWITDYLEEGKEYVALPDADVAKAAETFTKLWEDAMWRAELARNGQQAVNARFTVERFVDALADRILMRSLDGDQDPAK